MRAGLLRNRVAFLEPIEGRDTSGGQTILYVERFTEWARIEPLSGGEALFSAQVLATLDTRITVRYSKRTGTISPKWRARSRDGTLYDIESTPNVELRNREIQMLCKSGAIAE